VRTGSHTVYIIPRDRLLAAGGAFTLAAAAEPAGDEDEEMLDGDVVLQDQEDAEHSDDEEILETEQVLSHDHCLENPPD